MLFDYTAYVYCIAQYVELHCLYWLIGTMMTYCLIRFPDTLRTSRVLNAVLLVFLASLASEQSPGTRLLSLVTQTSDLSVQFSLIWLMLRCDQVVSIMSTRDTDQWRPQGYCLQTSCCFWTTSTNFELVQANIWDDLTISDRTRSASSCWRLWKAEIAFTMVQGCWKTYEDLRSVLNDFAALHVLAEHLIKETFEQSVTIDLCAL